MTLVSKNSLSQIRDSFLQFFAKNHEHSIIPSSSLVPHNDPTLMFTNAGMVQFKNVFSGREELKNKNTQKINRATTAQKCVRAGGKHNDLENVGYTARHHTFFEMLGNFSFGDYFKELAIESAWQYLTKTLELPKEKLLVTVYHTDDEAANLWKKIAGLHDDKIIRIASDDNFWAMGDTGPCGPCSEIFYDHGEHIKGGKPGSADQDGDRFIEIWNLVFMQYEKQADGKLINLPKPCIDTGMGLERLTTVMQGVNDNYKIDLFLNLIEASKLITRNNKPESEFSHRVVADHLRSTCFLIADGVLPSNEGRGYVLRRIMRRAMRHCHILEPKDLSFYKLVPYLVKEMGDSYTELKRTESLIINTIENEEKRFKETLENGLKILESEIEGLNKGDVLNGETAFKLYDTYGFPLDLTQDILKAKNIAVDVKSFETSMEKQKDIARKAWAGSGEQATENLWLDILKDNGATEFFGYSSLSGEGKIIALVQNGEIKNDISGKIQAQIILNQTPFYGESGGQTGDKGYIFTNGAKFKVTDTKKLAGSLIVHFGEVEEGEFKTNSQVKLQVDETRRKGLRRAHSATHLLHAALRKILGDFVTQKGSLVEDDYLRFDFSNLKAVSLEDLNKIENEVNLQIIANTNSNTAVMPVKQAIEAGAMALFGEKYGDEVRVISMGENKYSVELCGGTHIESTGDIGLFKITSESSVASGVRRIEAVTGMGALNHINNRENIILNLQDKLKTNADELNIRVEKLLDEKKEQEKEISELKKKAALSAMNNNVAGGAEQKEFEQLKDAKLIAKKLSGVDAKDLRGIVDEYKKKFDDSVIILLSENDGKGSLVVGVSDKLTAKYNAVEIIKNISSKCGGKGGGGRPDFAQGGVPDVSGFDNAVNEFKNVIK
jgi:alanyl-tRNA synthetase